MKKIVYKLNITIMSLVLAIICLCPLISLSSAKAQTEEPAKYSLVPSIYNEDGKALENYNIDASKNLYPFQPFDFEKGARKEGYSFRFNENENNQIVNQYVLVDEQEDISKDKELSLFLWIYFDNVYMNNLKITLEFENGSTLIWSCLNSQLYELLNGGQDGLNVIPYAWNQFEFKFSNAEQIGEIVGQENYLQVSKMYVDYTSEVQINNTSRIMMYDIYLAQSLEESNVIKDTQPYSFGKSFSFSDEVLNSVCVGDSLYVPLLSKAIEYAWFGETNLKSEAYVTKQVILQKPDVSETVISFGSKITFQEEGEYKLIYKFYNTAEEDTIPVMTFSHEINVQTIKGVYFSKSSLKIEVGKRYIIKVNASSKLDDLSEFSFISSSDNLVYTYKGDGNIEIYAKEPGEYDLTSTIYGTRPASPEAKAYEDQIRVVASASDKEESNTLHIVLWVALGVLVVSLGIYGIISLVKANKYDVK